MKSGWIIYPRYVSEQKDNAFGWLTAEAAEYGIRLGTVFVEDLAVLSGSNGRHSILDRGAAIGELPGFAVMRSYEYELSSQLEQMGVPVINNTASMALCKNKVLTNQMLSAHGLPVPETLFNPSGAYIYDEVSSLFGSPRFIVKRIDGAKGEEVFLVGNEHELSDALHACRGKALCQRFIETSMGRDIRVWTIGGKAVAAVERFSEASFKSNFSTGGSVRPYAITREVAELAEKASDILGSEFAGVDLLFGPEGLIVNEVNGNAGFRTLSLTGDNNIPAKLFEYISQKY